MFDENDGFFDHVIPATPPQSSTDGISTVPTTDEVFTGNAEFPAGPYGLGVRVPMIVISPWSKGGWVNSEVFDHTSLIRFIERRFGKEFSGITESNITPWRRAVAGDLTSAFDFESPNNAIVPLPSTISFMPPDNLRHPDYKPVPPTPQAMPQQETGTRPARAVPYELHVNGEVNDSKSTVELRFHNTGEATAVFQVRFGDGQNAPRSYTVGPNQEVSDIFPAGAGNVYDLSVLGPNGFLRTFAGSLVTRSANLSVRTIYNPRSEGIGLEIRNHSNTSEKIRVVDAYSGQTTTHNLEEHDSLSVFSERNRTFGWYDFTLTADSDSSFLRQIAGHVETGKDSVTDPAIGAPSA
jgi:phospholipase C